MKILALDTSSKAGSVAVLDNGTLLGEYYINVGKTHSQTIMPMTQSLLASCDCTIADMELLAVTSGPGSFTGLRIGLSAVKGMAFATGVPCVAVSTLHSLAWNLSDFHGIICAVMDARCQQVYTAIFRGTGASPTRLMEDDAQPLTALVASLAQYDEPIILVGDGACLCYTALQAEGIACTIAATHLNMQHASSVARAAEEIFAHGGQVSATELAPTYLRLPQAERELAERELLKKTEKGV